MSKNYVLALVEAVENDQTTLEKLQMVDAEITQGLAKIEYNIYQEFQKILEADAGYISYWAKRNNPNYVSQWQATFNLDSAKAQSNESQMDGVVQSGQQQTSSDASNLQMKAQMVQAINSIMTTISGFLGRITA